MPLTYRNATAPNIGTTYQVLYTCPVGTVAIVNTVHFTCTHALQDSTVNVRAAGVVVANAVALPRTNPFELTDRNPYVLTANQTIEVSRGATGTVDVFLCVVEET